MSLSCTDDTSTRYNIAGYLQHHNQQDTGSGNSSSSSRERWVVSWRRGVRNSFTGMSALLLIFITHAAATACNILPGDSSGNDQPLLLPCRLNYHIGCFCRWTPELLLRHTHRGGYALKWLLATLIPAALLPDSELAYYMDTLMI